jgi:CRP/FNR family transcriptional regulator, cyclic AMP receptor protein
MSEVTGTATIRERFAALPLEAYEAGATVLAAGSSTGRLLLLEQGLVQVVRDGVQLADLGEPGTMFGELALLLGRPHTCDVVALECSTFRVADAAGLLRDDPAVALHLAAVLARRLDLANHALVEVRRQLEAGQPRSAIGRALDRLGNLVRYGGDPELAPYVYTAWV